MNDTYECFGQILSKMFEYSVCYNIAHHDLVPTLEMHTATN